MLHGIAATPAGDEAPVHLHVAFVTDATITVSAAQLAINSVGSTG